MTRLAGRRLMARQSQIDAVSSKIVRMLLKVFI